MKTCINGIFIDFERDATLAAVSFGAVTLAVKATADHTLYILNGSAAAAGVIQWIADPCDAAVRDALEDLYLEAETVEKLLDDYRRSTAGKEYRGVCVTGSPFQWAAGRAPDPVRCAGALGRYLVIDGYGDNALDFDRYNEIAPHLNMDRWLALDRAVRGYGEEDQYWFLRDRGYDVDADFPYLDRNRRPRSPYTSPKKFDAVPLWKYFEYFTNGDRSVVTPLHCFSDNWDATDSRVRLFDAKGEEVEYEIVIGTVEESLVGYAFCECRSDGNMVTMPIYTLDVDGAREGIRDAVIDSAVLFEHLEASEYKLRMKKARTLRDLVPEEA